MTSHSLLLFHHYEIFNQLQHPNTPVFKVQLITHSLCHNIIFVAGSISNYQLYQVGFSCGNAPVQHDSSLPPLITRQFLWMVPWLAHQALVFASLSWRGFWGGVLANHQLHLNGFPLLQRPGTPPRFVTCFPPQPMLLLLAAGSSSAVTTTILSLLVHPNFMRGLLSVG